LNSKDRIAFLFGAGISIPAKIPSTGEISEILLNSKEIVRGLAENFYFDDPKRSDWSLYKDIPQRVQNFLNNIKTEIEQYYNNINRSVNYEDVYYLLDFIEYNYYESEGNPAFKYIFKEFEPKIKNLLIPLDPILEDSFDMNRLLSESKRYIRQTVSKLLAKKAESFGGLKFLKELLLLKEYKSLDIFTLNHDTVLEQFFKFNNVPFNDGFQKGSHNIEIWNSQLFDNQDRINLYKIHGSVDWHYYDGESWEDNRICKIHEIEKYDTISNAFILIGTHNKMSDYIKDLYLELFYRFYITLNNHSKLVVVGYGFNDMGINQKIFNWLRNSSNKIVIIDPEVEKLKTKFPPYLMDRWNENKNMKKIEDCVENIFWNKVKSEFETFINLQ